MTLAALDFWLGKALFLPPIIKLCQVTRQSQYAISRLLWFVVALDQMRLAQTIGQQILAGLFAVAMMLTASLRADMPASSWRWFRLLALVLLVLDVVQGVRAGTWEGVEIWLLILFAEYAATIRTIPPADAQRREKVSEGQAKHG
jgi:hypothetical protein